MSAMGSAAVRQLSNARTLRQNKKIQCVSVFIQCTIGLVSL